MAINANICPYACRKMAEHKFYEQAVINVHDRRTIRPAFFRAPVSVLTWTAQLSTKSNGHPLPVTACARGGLSGAVTKRWKEDGSYWGGNSAKT